MKRVALAPRAVRQLRRVRSVYLVGVMLSVLGFVLESGRTVGDRRLEIVGVFLVVFTALLGLTVVQLWRHRKTAHCSTSKKLTPSG